MSHCHIKKLAGLLVGLAPAIGFATEPAAQKAFRAGAAAVDVSPKKLPAVVNGGFLRSEAGAINDPLFARALVLDDGSTRLAIVVVDSCMMPRELIDRAKELATKASGIPTERMLVSATHTHSAPSAMPALGTEADAAYVEQLPSGIAGAIERAAENLAPARIGWAAMDDYDHTHCRRWIRKPNRLVADPFGDLSARANMHPGYLNPDAIGPAGPVDPGLSVLAVQTPAGRPIAVLANYSMHYFGAAPVSADYYGVFAKEMARLAGADGSEPAFIAMMSQGTSGDQQWMDYGQPKRDISMNDYGREVAERAFAVYRSIAYRDSVPLAMAETTLKLSRRIPDAQRLAWAESIIAKMDGPSPKTLPAVYAREAIELRDHPVRELKLQAIGVGDLGIVAIPNEVYAITGLKIKASSPFATTFTIELANGSEGYIPPPEQHKLGGYTTWPARTAGLEVAAETKIVGNVWRLLELVSGKPRKPMVESHGGHAKALLAQKPVAYWRLGEIEGERAVDSSGHDRHGRFEGGVAHYLDGAPIDAAQPSGATRAAHFAGGRMRAIIPELRESYAVSLWFWNGLPNDERPVTGTIVSLSAGEGADAPTLHVRIGGKSGAPGRLELTSDQLEPSVVTGETFIAPKTWRRLTLVGEARTLAIYLDESDKPALRAEWKPDFRPVFREISLGGKHDDGTRFEGKIDEAVVYDRVEIPR
jgi:hypothetical protein